MKMSISFGAEVRVNFLQQLSDIMFYWVLMFVNDSSSTAMLQQSDLMSIMFSVF